MSDITPEAKDPDDKKSTSAVAEPSPKRLLKNKKILAVVGAIVVTIAGAAIFWLMTHDTGEDPDKAVDTQGYTFLSMSQCNEDFKAKGYGPGPVNEACMK